jgi:hypothetical protein
MITMVETDCAWSAATQISSKSSDLVRQEYLGGVNHVYQGRIVHTDITLP